MSDINQKAVAHMLGKYGDEIERLRARVAELEAILFKGIEQMECVQENLHKSMSKSIQRLQGYALMETVAEMRAAIDAARGAK